MKRTITCRNPLCEDVKKTVELTLPEDDVPICASCGKEAQIVSEFWVRPGKLRRKRPSADQAARTNEQLRKRNTAYDNSRRGQEERHETVDRLRKAGTPVGKHVPGLLKS